jgi:hypothetical protein
MPGMWILLAPLAIANPPSPAPPAPPAPAPAAAGLTGVLDEPVTLTTAVVSAEGDGVALFFYDVPLASCDAFWEDGAPRPRAVIHGATWTSGSWDLADHPIPGKRPFFLLYGKDHTEVPKVSAGQPPPKAHLDILSAPTDYGAAGRVRVSIARDATHTLEGTVAAVLCSAL